MNNQIKLFIAIILSCLGLYFAFSGESFENFVFNISKVSLPDIFIAIMLLILSCLPRALRWKLIAEPFGALSFHHVFSATMIGYFGNSILVFRLGEILKAYALANGNKINTSQAIGTVLVERILDLIMVLLVFLLTFSSFPFYDKKIKIGITLSIALVIFSVILIIVTYKLNLLPKILRLKIFSNKLGQKIVLIINKLFEGTVSIFKNNNIILITLLSILIWSIYYYIGVIVLKACDITLGYADAGILLVISSLILGVPSLPGAAGTLDVGVKYTLILIFNISASKALTYSIISHAISYFPLLIIGFIYFLMSNVNLKEIKEARDVGP